jgi:hypothetical protein
MPLRSVTSEGDVSPSDDRATISLQNDTIVYVCQSLPTTLNKSNQISIVLKVRDGIRMFHSVCIVGRRAEIDFSAIYFDATQTENCIVSQRATIPWQAKVLGSCSALIATTSSAK